MQSQGRKVAVIGMGGAFPTCSGLADFNEKLFSNKSLIREWDEAVAYGKQIRSTACGFIREAEMGLEPIFSTIVENYVETYIDKLERIPDANLATADIGSIWAMLGALDAIKMAGWTIGETESEQTGVVIGSGSAGQILRPAWHNFFELGKKTRVFGSHNVDRAMVYRDAANVSCLIKNKGVCEAIGSACATGLGNIGYAYRLIKFGIQDRAIAGGVEGTSLETFIGFDAMQIVLSRGFPPHESSRPFDANRNGFVCSFGAGIVALEEYEMAKARGANILGVIDNYFNNSDGDGNMFFPSFAGQKRLWKGLMGDFGLKPDVVKVHGTSTPAGDSIELLSVVDALGEEGYHISAPKSQLGHMLGAAGSVEFITALMMLREQKVLPCLNSVNLNTELEPFQKAATWEGPVKPLAAYRHLLPQQSFAKEINTVACFNYGFGGTNSAISVSKDQS
jgi:3-oxoacyl-[acyl-carrier-protein] synthase-1